jgi:C4-dicarboxylate transporter, DctQ subunit
MEGGNSPSPLTPALSPQAGRGSRKVRAVRPLQRGYDALIFGMAWLAGALLAAMFAAIVIDVVLRNLGFQSSAHLFTFTEYALLMVPCFGAPWLVRERGHVFVEIGLNALAPAARRRAVTFIGVVCIAICLVIAWYGGASNERMSMSFMR